MNELTTREQLVERIRQDNCTIHNLVVRMQCAIIASKNGDVIKAFDEWIVQYLEDAGFLPDSNLSADIYWDKMNYASKGGK